MQKLITNRLDLVASTAQSCQLELSDLAGFASLLNAALPDIWPLVPPKIIEMWVRELQNPQQAGWRNWVFVRRGALDMVVGGGGFKGPPDGNGVVEIGYSIAPQFHHQGYATEGIGALVRWAFEDSPERLRVRRILAQVLPDNRASERVLEKNGFRRCELGADESTPKWELMRPL